jgi:glycosyltransferase involved in cell wall biosynthesis
MRVMILTNCYAPNVGGVETHLSDLTAWLGSRPDLDVDIITYQPLTTPVKAPPFEQHGRLRIHRIAWPGGGLFHKLESKPILQFLYLAPRLFLGGLFHIGFRARPDVINAHGLAAIWAAGWLRRLLRVPVLGCLHAVYAFPAGSKTAQRMVRVASSVSRLLALSDASVRQFIQYGLPAERAGRFTYWVDQTRFQPGDRAAARRELGWPAKTCVCLFVGRLIAIKGARVVIELAETMPGHLFVVAGEGPLEAECRAAAARLPNFRFLGAIPNTELVKFYRAADMLLVPSQYDEGFGRVVCESLSCGTPVVAANKAGLVEAVTGSPGLLAEPECAPFAEAIAKLSEQLRNDPGVRAACRRFAEEHFSLRNAAQIEAELRAQAPDIGGA